MYSLISLPSGAVKIILILKFSFVRVIFIYAQNLQMN